MSKSLKDVKISDSYPRLVQQIDGIFYDGAGNPILGISGPCGVQGSQGPKGLTGNVGPQGFQGNNGPQGFQGNNGPQGINGSSLTKFIATTGYPTLTSDTSVTFTAGIQYIESLQLYDSDNQTVIFTIRFPDALLDGDVISFGLIDSEGLWRFYGDVFNDSSNIVNIYAVPDTSAILVASIGINTGDILSFHVNNTTIDAYKSGVLVSTTSMNNNIVYRARVAASTIISNRNVDMLNLYSVFPGPRGAEGPQGAYPGIPTYISSGNSAPGSAVVANDTNVNINFSDGGSSAWSFGATSMSFPDATIQTTAYIPNYKVYTALLTQSGTEPPVPNVLENTLGFNPVWNRNSAGLYFLSSSDGFPLLKTIVIFCKNHYSDSFCDFYVDTEDTNSNDIYITTNKNNSSSDDLLQNTPIEIRVYN